MRTTDLPIIVSLFSGAGGLDLGFRLEQFQIAFAADNSAAAIATHRRNFPEAKSIQIDLSETDVTYIADEIAEAVPFGSSIGIIGGPPCQGFSQANNGAYDLDPRNSLVDHYLNLVDHLQSRFHVTFVLFENVRGIKYKKHRATYARLLSRLENAKLHPRSWELDALDFGAPQVRKRIIISGFDRADRTEVFNPLPARLDDPTVWRAIGDLEEPAYFRRNLEPTKIPCHVNHWTMQPRSPRFQEGRYAIGWERSFRRLEWDRPSPTIAYGNREIPVHPLGHRRLSVFEAMLLQGFPPTFELSGTFSEQVEQVSNAVPPPLAQALARAVTVAVRVGTVLEELRA